MTQPTTWRSAVRRTATAALTAALLAGVVPGAIADNGNDATNSFPPRPNRSPSAPWTCRSWA